MRINGVDVAERFGFVLSGGYPSGLGLPPIRPRLSTVPGRHGVRNMGAIYDAREVEIQGQIWADDFADAQNQLDDFKAWIALPQNLLKHLVGTRGIEGMKLELATWRPGRYFLVSYNGTSEVSAMPNADEAWEGVEVFQFSVGFLATPPFMVGDQVVKKITTTGFHEITGLGTAPVNPTYHIFGANTSPTKIVKAKHVLTCDFKSINTSGNPNKARDIFNDVDKTLTLTPAFRYMPGRLSQGIGIFGNTIGNKGDTATLKSMIDGSAPTSAITDRLNRNQGTLSIWITPEWKYTTGRVRYVFADGASGELTISYNSTSDRWEASDGTNVAFKASTHAAGSRIHLVVTWDKNANSLAITVDNSAGTGASYAASTPSATLYLGSDSSSEQQIDAIVDDFGIWDIVLSSAEITTLYNGGNGARADSVASDSLLVYLEFDGTQGTSIDVATANLGSGNGHTLKTTSIADGATEDTVTVAAGAQAIFFDGDRVVIYDETGYKVEGVVDGNLSSDTTILIDDGAGADPGLTERVGVYADLDGSTQYFSVADNASLSIVGDLTIQGCIKTTEANGAIAAKWKANTNERSYTLGLVSGALSLAISDDGTNTEVQTGTDTVNDGKWHHVACVYDATAETVVLYIDGIADSGGTLTFTTETGALNNNSSAFTIGAVDNGSGLQFDPLTVAVRDVALFKDKRTAAEILDAATNPFKDYSGDENNVSQWLFNEADGVSTINDENTTNNNDLTINGTPSTFTTGLRTQLAYISKNLIADPGMENGGIGAIDVVGTPSANVKESDPKKDVQSIRIVADAAGEGFSQTINATSGQDYVLRFFGKKDVGTYDVNITNGGGVVLNGLNEESFTFQETCFEVTGNPVVQFLSNANLDDFNIDDIKVLKNIVNNGGMEGTYSGGVAPSWTEFDAGADGTPASDTGRSGTFAQKITNDAGSGGPGIQQTLTLVVGRWYELNFWYKTTATGSNKALITIGSGNYFFSGSVSWVRQSVVFSATDTSPVLFLRNSSSVPTEVAWFDDVSIIHRPNLDETKNPLGAGFHYLPTRDYQGVYVRGGDTLVLSSIVANKDEFGFAVRLQPQFDSAASATGEDKTIFTFRYDASNFYRVYYDWSDALWKLHVEHAGSTFMVESAVQTFSEGDFIELSGRYKGDGTVAAIQVNGTAYTTTTGTPGALASNPTAFHTGYSLDGLTFTEAPNALIDDFAIFAKAPTADELVAIWTQQTQLANLNSAMVINLAMAAGDRYTADVDAQTFSFYDASVPSETDGGTYLSDRSFPTFTAEPDNRTLLYIPNAAKEIQAVHRPAYL